jgi:hypothetical protein
MMACVPHVRRNGLGQSCVPPRGGINPENYTEKRFIRESELPLVTRKDMCMGNLSKSQKSTPAWQLARYL